MKNAPNLIRWLSLSADPLSVEDWLANRELLGIIDDSTELATELDLAFKIEEVRAANSGPSKVAALDYPHGLPLPVFLHGYEPSGLVEYEDFVVFAPVGRMEVGKPIVELELVLDWKGLEKITILGGDIWSFVVPEEQSAKLKVKTKGGVKIGGKGEQSWSGKGKKKLVVDGRGRPMTFHPASKQRSMLAKLKEGDNRVEKVSNEEVKTDIKGKKEEHDDN